MLNLLPFLALSVESLPPILLQQGANLVWSLAVAVLVILLILFLVRAAFRVAGVVGAIIVIVLLLWFVF